MTIGDVAGEGGCQNERVIHADGADDVAEDAVVAPELERFLFGLGKAVVGDGGEVLFGAGVLIGQQQLVGADEAERVIALAGHGVLAAFAAGEGHDGGAGAHAARLEGHHAAVFVVGMGNGEHEAGPGVELAQSLRQARGAAIFGKRLRIG